MAKQQFIRKTPSDTGIKKLLFTEIFRENLAYVLDYSLQNWGALVTNTFTVKVENETDKLTFAYGRNPKCRFIESTATKTYRNILINSYFIVYVVKKDTVTVLDIIYQGRCPANIKKQIKAAEN